MQVEDRESKSYVIRIVGKIRQESRILPRWHRLIFLDTKRLFCLSKAISHTGTAYVNLRIFLYISSLLEGLKGDLCEIRGLVAADMCR